MSVGRVTEITSTSEESFEDAIRTGVAKANETLRNISGAWVKEQNVMIDNGKITAFRVDLMVTFILE